MREACSTLAALLDLPGQPSLVAAGGAGLEEVRQQDALVMRRPPA